MFVHDMRTYKLSSQVFTIFDDNGDELLSNREFISVLKERAHRGLEKVYTMQQLFTLCFVIASAF